jgi:hypothetical protein
MADVFINYRTEDGDAASRLGDWLNREFDVFIDTSGLKEGEDLEAGIMTGLSGVRVVVSVIGPNWMTPGSLARFQNPADWIRRELATVAKRADITVLTVQVGDVAMPRAAQLPQDMHGLFRNLAFQLRRKSWEDDVGKLMDRIRDCLAATPAPREPLVPRELPYLCDRVVQENDLTNLVTAVQSTRSLVCMLDGHTLEEHDGFVTRLEQRKVLEDLFSAGNSNVEVRRVQWNRPLARAGKYDAVLASLIKSDIMHKRIAKDEELRQFLLNPGGPMVVMLEITAEDLATSEGLLPGLQNAWQALVASLGAVPTHFLALWFNVVYESDAAAVPSGLTVPRLTKLGPVEPGDIREWLKLDEVRKLLASRKGEIEALASNPQFYLTPGKIHMRRFADAVCDLIPGS